MKNSQLLIEFAIVLSEKQIQQKRNYYQQKLKNLEKVVFVVAMPVFIGQPRFQNNFFHVVSHKNLSIIGCRGN